MAAVLRQPCRQPSRRRTRHAGLGWFRKARLGARPARHRHHRGPRALRARSIRRQARRARIRGLRRRGARHDEPITACRPGSGRRRRSAAARRGDSRSDDVVAPQVHRGELPGRRDLHGLRRRGTTGRGPPALGLFARNDRAGHLEAVHVQPPPGALAGRSPGAHPGRLGAARTTWFRWNAPGDTKRRFPMPAWKSSTPPGTSSSWRSPTGLRR